MMPADPTKVDDFFNGLFAEKRNTAARIAQIREEAKIQEYRDAAQRELGIRKNCLKSAEYWDREFERDPYEASVGFTQLMYIASTRGWNKPVEKPEDSTPVFDRTSTGKKVNSLNPAREGARPSYGLTLQNEYEMEVAKEAEDIYRKLVAGVPFKDLRKKKGGGRPSKAWQAGYQRALERLEREAEESGDRQNAAE